MQFHSLLIIKGLIVGIFAGLVSVNFIQSFLVFLPVFVLGFSSVYYFGKMNQKINDIEYNLQQINNRLDKIR